MRSDDGAHACLSGNSEAGRALRELDWSATSLGPVDGWPRSLGSAVGMLLHSKFPMYVAWGPDLVGFHNDAFQPLLSTAERALGRRSRDTFEASWESTGPLFQSAMRGESVSGERAFDLERSGSVEECHFLFTYSPILDESDAVGGVLVTAVESTARVLGERRTRTFCELSLPAAAEDSWESIRRALATNPADLPFVLLYELETTRDHLTLMAATPDAVSDELAPAQLELRDARSPWPFAALGDGRRSILVEHPGPPARDWPGENRGSTRALILPLARSGGPRPDGFFVVGLRGSRLDDTYREFVETLAAQVGLIVAHARATDEARRRAESLEYNRAALYELFMQAPAPICVLCGPELVFELANSSVIRMIGRDDVLGRPLLDVVPELAEQDIFANLLEVLHSGGTYAEHESLVRLGKPEGAGEERYFTCVFSALRRADGIADRVMVFASEVTDQVRARTDLDDARRRAEAGSRAKDEFMAMLGHELRNPLAPITTALELMQQRGEDTFVRERNIIGRQVQHLTRLVDDLLDVSRIIRGKIHLRTRSVELAEPVARAIELASPLLEERRHRLRVDVPPRGLLVLVDELRLAQVVANLLTNAAKYTDPDGDVWIQAEQVDHHVVLRVRDSGIGIAPELLPHVFELFVQGKRPQAGAGGLGLGLALVRSLTELHGGTVAVRSAGLGRGSEFELTFPWLAAPVTSGHRTERRSLPPLDLENAVRRRVMVVDDNEDAAELLAEGLRRYGHEVRVAFEGPRGIDLARAFRPHVALLDLGLPVMDGYELARRLHGLPEAADTLLIAVTGYGQDKDRHRSDAAGFVRHLVKPIDLPSVDQHIRQLLPDEAVAR